MPPAEDAPRAVHATQAWMLRIITHDDGVEAGFEAARAEGLLPEGVQTVQDLVPGNDDVDSFAQLHIYAYAYFARQIEVMEGEYPTLGALYGEERFAALCRAYLVAHPSRSYSLDHLSKGFPAYVRDEATDWPHHRFAADVAEVERTMEDLWDYATAARLTPEALAAVPPEAWPDARLDVIEAFRLLHLAHPVGPTMIAARNDEPLEVPDPLPSWEVVYRNGRQVWRMSVTDAQAALITALRDGQSLGEALMGLADVPGVDLAEVQGQIGAWFQEWTEEGWFERVRLPA